MKVLGGVQVRGYQEVQRGCWVGAYHQGCVHPLHTHHITPLRTAPIAPIALTAPQCVHSACIRVQVLCSMAEGIDREPVTWRVS
jgi:hypothetical protein